MKNKEIAQYRLEQLKKQKYICPLCEQIIHPKQAVLDHCHDTGVIRMVLHRNCNGLEGRLQQWARRSGINKTKFLRNVANYWTEDFDNPIHPKHKR